jgi:two-component system, cell cycle sensor histidine kinase and response regulator CckA
MMREAATERRDLRHRNEELSSANKDLRHVNEALVLASGRYVALHDLCPTPFITIDPGGHIKEVNRAAEALLGAARAELLDQQFLEFVEPAMATTMERQLVSLFTTGSATGIELSVLRDGDRIAVLIDAIVLPDQDVVHAVLACVDITTRKLDEAAKALALRRAEETARLQSLGVLAGGIAHDFNNLMTVVLAGSDFVLGELDPSSPHVQPLTEVRQAARHAGDLAHQMLAYSGHVTTPPHPIDIVALVRDLVPLVHASAKSTPVVFELAEDVPFVLGDEAPLRQVLLNLVVNAAEAMVDRPGAITIAIRRATADESARAAADHLPNPATVIEVRDAGIGIDAETKARIFDPYYSTKFTGRGLGLSVVQGVVRGHGGAVRVESVPGHGTRVSVYLRAITARVPPVRPPVAYGTYCTGTVLVVDDDEAVRRTLGRTLRKLGLEVVVASTPEDAIEIARGALVHIDLVLTDLTMPGMNGITLARALHALRPELPVILITGYGEVERDSEHLFAASLVKPFETSQLLATLRTVLPAAPP